MNKMVFLDVPQGNGAVDSHNIGQDKADILARIQSFTMPPSIRPFLLNCRLINFPNLLELLLYTVLAFPNASMIGL